MSDRKATLIFIGIVLFTVLMLGISVRGPEATLDWILARADQFLAWVFNK